jgi:hypothetical protein
MKIVLEKVTLIRLTGINRALESLEKKQKIFLHR